MLFGRFKKIWVDWAIFFLQIFENYRISLLRTFKKIRFRPFRKFQVELYLTWGLGQPTRGLRRSTRGLGRLTGGLGWLTRSLGQLTQGLRCLTHGLGRPTRGLGWLPLVANSGPLVASLGLWVVDTRPQAANSWPWVADLGPLWLTQPQAAYLELQLGCPSPQVAHLGPQPAHLGLLYKPKIEYRLGHARGFSFNIFWHVTLCRIPPRPVKIDPVSAFPTLLFGCGSDYWNIGMCFNYYSIHFSWCKSLIWHDHWKELFELFLIPATKSL